MNNGKYCPEIVAEICKYRSEGLSAKDSAVLAGVSPATYWAWINDPDKLEFVDALKKAESAFKKTHLDNIAVKSQKNAFFSCWLLERSFGDEYGLKTHQQLSGFIADGLTEADRAERQKLVNKKLAEMLAEINSAKQVKVEIKK